MYTTFAKMKADEREDRKRILISTAESLLDSKDPVQIRMKDITDTLKISAPSVYRYFENKDAIFLELLKRKADIFSKPESEESSELINYFNKNKKVRNLVLYFTGNQRSLSSKQKNEFNYIRNIFFGISESSAETNLLFNKICLRSRP